jgi:hypothetical protein
MDKTTMDKTTMDKAMNEVDNPLHDMHDGSKRFPPMSSSSSAADSDVNEMGRMKTVLENSSIPGIYGGSRSRSKSKKSKLKKSKSKKSKSKKSKSKSKKSKSKKSKK